MPVPHRRLRRRPSGFTLIEILAALGVIVFLAVLLVPVGKNALTNAEMAKDTGNLKSYGQAVHAMANDYSVIGADDILHFTSKIEPYVGSANDTSRLLNSALWNRLTKPVAAAEGKKVGPKTRSYTLNQMLFPAKQPTVENPSPQPWELDGVSSITLRSVMNKPMLFTGVYLGGHDGAYVWGVRPHANPIYSGIQKSNVSNNPSGKTLVLFVGGHTRVVDFAKENLPTSGPGADPEQWWVRAQ